MSVNTQDMEIVHRAFRRPRHVRHMRRVRAA